MSHFSLPFTLLTFGHVQLGSTEQNNHGSVHNIEIEKWFRGLQPINNSLKVLDVGGGKGNLFDLMTNSNPTLRIKYSCIDIIPQTKCEKFNGMSMPNIPSKSFDLVVFKYMLHHSGDHTINLLEEGRRIGMRYVLVVEDLKGKTKVHAQRNFQHEWAGTFRGKLEWEKIFQLLGYSIIF